MMTGKSASTFHDILDDDLCHEFVDCGDESLVLLRSPRCPHHSLWDRKFIAMRPNNARSTQNSTFEKFLPSDSTEIATNDQNKEEWSIPESYMKLDVLGRSSFGTVYRCYDRMGDRAFVSKETANRSVTNTAVARSEIELLQQLNHPNIIGYYGSVFDDEYTILYIEHMNAGSLLKRIQHFGSLTDKTAIVYIRQAIEALAYIHAKGIVHIDLKCDNLLLDDNETLKITDFGSAVMKSVQNSGSQFFCPYDDQFGVSLYWSAPEILNHEKFDQSADIWSLGCTIVEMLTGEPPYWLLFETEFLASVEARILSYAPNKLVPKSSEAMKLFLSFLLQSNRRRRVRNGADARIKLKEIFQQCSIFDLFA